jgi:hypothetical protein
MGASRTVCGEQDWHPPSLKVQRKFIRTDTRRITEGENGLSTGPSLGSGAFSKNLTENITNLALS